VQLNATIDGLGPPDTRRACFAKHHSPNTHLLGAAPPYAQGEKATFFGNPHYERLSEY